MYPVIDFLKFPSQDATFNDDNSVLLPPYIRDYFLKDRDWRKYSCIKLVEITGLTGSDAICRSNWTCNVE